MRGFTDHKSRGFPLCHQFTDGCEAILIGFHMKRGQRLGLRSHGIANGDTDSLLAEIKRHDGFLRHDLPHPTDFHN